jgi:hypothetical protein
MRWQLSGSEERTNRFFLPDDLMKVHRFTLKVLLFTVRFFVTHLWRKKYPCGDSDLKEPPWDFFTL